MAEPFVEWRFYDPHGDANESQRNLPHIDMPGVVTFVTLRLADSMPRTIVQEWHDEVDDWLVANNLSGYSVNEVMESDNTPNSIKVELRRLKNRKWHGHLDDCHGACVLRDPGIRQHVVDSLLYFNESRYDIERFVIMPNHVHVLIQTRRENLIRKQFREIMRFSARKINNDLARAGDLWRSEPFDHLVRSEAQFEYLQDYIANNPVKAGLSEGEYSLWMCEASRA